MILATTTEDFHPFTDSHCERVWLCAEAGFKHIDLSLYTLIKDDPLFGDGWRQAAEDLLSYAESLGVRFVQCHAPAVNCLAKDGFERAVRLTERAIEICGVLHIPIMVTHAGYDAVANEDAWREGNLRFYRALMPKAEQNGVRVLAENSAHVNIKGYYLYNGKALRAFADETRPLLQGARLTSYELQKAGVDVTLICDNMASIVMRNGWVQACFVGCDRIAANGDFANKIGTSGVAILAKHYGIPVYTLGPSSTIDMSCPDGEHIEIELRDPNEIKEKFYSEPMALKEVKCYNPAFDVTDHELLSGIVTEKGIVYPPFAENLKKLFG